MGLDLTLLTSEEGPCPEANILGQAGPHELGGQEPPRCPRTRMRKAMNSKEQLMAKSRRNQRQRRTRGHITEDGGPEKRNGDHGERGWKSPTERRDRRTVGQGEWKNLNPG